MTAYTFRLTKCGRLMSKGTEPHLNGLKDADGTGQVVEPSAGPQSRVNDLGLRDQVIPNQGVHAFGFKFIVKCKVRLAEITSLIIRNAKDNTGKNNSLRV